MKLSELKIYLNDLTEVVFRLPNGEQVPSHFHVTEVGSIKKHFIDCGGTIRQEESINFQLWSSDDFDHRLAPYKLKSIVELSERHLNLGDHEIEVEYQGEGSIEKFGLDVVNGEFILTSKYTTCLAKDQCVIPAEKPRVKLSSLNQSSCCEPNSGCC